MIQLHFGDSHMTNFCPAMTYLQAECILTLPWKSCYKKIQITKHSVKIIVIIFSIKYFTNSRRKCSGAVEGILKTMQGICLCLKHIVSVTVWHCLSEIRTNSVYNTKKISKYQKVPKRANNAELWSLVFFVVSLNKLMNKPLSRWWSETLCHSYNVTALAYKTYIIITWLQLLACMSLSNRLYN